MRILGITDQPIDPPLSGGGERVRFLYERLARRHDVEVVALVGLRQGHGVRRVAPRLVIRKVRAPQRTLAYRLERARVAPAFAAHAFHAALAPLYARLLRRPGWDVVQADGVALGPLLALARGRAPTVYSAHNVETEYHAAALDAFALRKPLAGWLARIERRMVRSADLVVTVSERDRDLLAALTGAPAEAFACVPNGYDEERFRPLGGADRLALRNAMGFTPGEWLILFSGSRVPHNEAAVAALLRSVVPSLRPPARLLVVGQVGAAIPYVGDARVVVTGAVPDVVPYFQAADVAVNPVESGGGTNIKVLQALAAGLPVVSTRFGMRGLEALAPFVRVASIGEMARAASPPAARPGPGLADAIAPFSWGALALRLEEAYARLLARGAGARAEGVA
jgi:glycosyltransferase involved in cell wall biosynthesis